MCLGSRRVLIIEGSLVVDVFCIYVMNSNFYNCLYVIPAKYIITFLLHNYCFLCGFAIVKILGPRLVRCITE